MLFALSDDDWWKHVAQDCTQRVSWRVIDRECQPDVVNCHLGLLMSTMNQAVRATEPIPAINELDLKITAHELQSGETMADVVNIDALFKA